MTVPMSKIRSHKSYLGMVVSHVLYSYHDL